MADKEQTAVTNGEFYDQKLQSWCVQCGPVAVPIRKLDKAGQPVPPPVAKVSNSE